MRRKYRVPLIFEPLNRYETNLVNSVAEGVPAAPFAVNGQREAAGRPVPHEHRGSIAAAACGGERNVGHVHLVDSNRRPAGCGHTDFAPIAAALRDIGYDGYVSAEALPYPNPDEAARLTIAAFRKYFAEP